MASIEDHQPRRSPACEGASQVPSGDIKGADDRQVGVIGEKRSFRGIPRPSTVWSVPVAESRPSGPSPAPGSSLREPDRFGVDELPDPLAGELPAEAGVLDAAEGEPGIGFD